MLRKTRAITVVAAVATTALAASVIGVFATSQDDGLKLRPTADTTLTQVTQDGDTSVKTTLASCPRLCDGNPNGQRDAVLQFAIDKLPPTATAVTATLRLHAWRDFPARILARVADGGPELQTKDKVAKGYNDFDVSAAIHGNGNYGFALQQLTHNSRVYWASKENTRESLRPELILKYRLATAPTLTPPLPSPATSPGATTKPSTAPSPSKPAVSPTPTPSSTASAKPGTPAKPGAPAPAVPAGYRLVFNDEFNGNTIDRRKWNVRGAEGRDIDLGCNTNSPKNSFTSGGYLTIRARKESSRCSSQTRQYTQAYLDTIGKSSYKYGRFEMRAKSPNKPNTSRGLWPAFWLRPNDGGNGEIDVVELPGGSGWYRKATQAIFWDYTPVKQDTRTSLPGGGYPGDGFHTYTTEWDSKELRWYLDGKLIWKRDKSTTPWFDKAFHKPYNLRLNFQVGGWLGNPDRNTTFPADFVVDYIKVWQR